MTSAKQQHRTTNKQKGTNKINVAMSPVKSSFNTAEREGGIKMSTINGISMKHHNLGN